MASAASTAEAPKVYVLPQALASEGVSTAIMELVDRVRPSVVQVRVGQRGLGAGVVWDGDGGIITNAHVVGEADQVSVLFADGHLAQARVVRRAPSVDLALLQTSAGTLAPAYVGESARLRVGQLVFAIGHPWGQRGVVTAGIVSGTGQLDVRFGGHAAEYIRSDVRLAPGNSGGPMLDAHGRVVGINAMIWGGDLGVAIPVHVVLAWLARSRPGRAYLGVELREVEAPPAGTSGLLVLGLRPDGPAERAGLFPGDVLLTLDGAPLPTPDTLSDLLAARPVGSVALLDILRGGALQRLEVTLAAAED
ncbi:MAG TPA: trypsin-like peptidase domain-containing protein [Chloroflexota bacterium]|nr:trypsin-like peptidase domain-containing protein [Chloroflexota bacterium]